MNNNFTQNTTYTVICPVCRTTSCLNINYKDASTCDEFFYLLDKIDFNNLCNHEESQKKAQEIYNQYRKEVHIKRG